LIAGRELRDRGARKEYAEPTSDEDFDDDDDDDDEDEEPNAEGHVTDHDDEENHEPPQRLTRRITLRLKSTAFQTMSQGSQQPDSNGAKHNGDDEDEDAPADDDPPPAIEAEIVEQVVEVQELVKLDDDDDDGEGGPRRLTRRTTRQQSVSQRDPVPERPSHGRKGVARQNHSAEKTNGDRKLPPTRDRRASIRSRLRKQMRRSSREQSKKKQPSDSEFEADEDDPADDDVSLGSGDRGVIDDGTEEDYSSAPRAKRLRKPPPSRGRSRRSRNVSDQSISDGNNDLEHELREIGAEIPHRPRQLRPTERMNYFIPPPPDKDDIFLPPSSTRKRPGTGRGFGGFGGFGGDFSNMGIGDRFRGITGLGTAGGADDSSDSVYNILLLLMVG
jgi:hypothetical protein